MIDVKHESRYNYTELLHLIEEAFLWGVFQYCSGYRCEGWPLKNERTPLSRPIAGMLCALFRRHRKSFLKN